MQMEYLIIILIWKKLLKKNKEKFKKILAKNKQNEHTVDRNTKKKLETKLEI